MISFSATTCGPCPTREQCTTSRARRRRLTVVQIAEFDDASVRRLLGNWPGIEMVGGPDRLFDMARKNSPLMRLARSPLLLTMMAYLHRDTINANALRQCLNADRQGQLGRSVIAS